MLEDLTVSTPCANSSFVLPQDFLGGCASNLRHIKLSTTVLVPWGSALFSNLTTLERDNLRLSSLEMLLAALTKMPGLELLTLRKSIPPPAHSPMRCPCVDLPNLKQLELTGLPSRCTDFLEKITISANTTLLLNLDCFSTMKDGALDLTWKRDVKFDPWSVQQGLEITRPNTSIHLSFDHLPVWAWPLDAAQVCFSAFASPRLRSFRISDDTMRWDVNVWRNLARTAPGLQRLAVGDIIQTVELCKALYPSGLNLVPADCCFPALSYLELTARQNHMMLAPDGGVTQLSTVLAHILAARAAAGCSTPEVVFIVPPSEGSPEGWSDAFQEAVPGIVVREHQWW
ncbi:hypothetical protein BD779DRAFT_1558810 [Infundibulicybe gibba]|nr:hypothetical protein BD779DRAFT_1558810 [Infundibulicybe gibba]